MGFAPTATAKARVAALRRRIAEAPRGMNAVVVGGGRSGIAAARLLSARSVPVTVLDDRVADAGGFPTRKLTRDLLAEADLVVLSPGVPRALSVLAEAIQRGVLVGEIELATWFLRLPLIGITGTNGKSTTTAMVGHILRTAGRRPFVGGNFGTPLSALALDPDAYDIAVVELSSYQLESVVDATFEVACWLNVTPDHTERYRDIEAYAAAKRRLLERRAVKGIGVLNAKDPAVSKAGIELGGPVRWFSGDAHSDLAGPAGTCVSAEEAIRTVAPLVAEAERYDLQNRRAIGAHNRTNMAAAIECTRHVGVSVEDVQLGLRTFGGLQHRLELVATEDGIRWFNDSKATNVDSTLTALNALMGPLILILGGRDKGASWAPLVEHIRMRPSDDAVVKVLTVGEAEALIAEAFRASGVAVEACGTLESAVVRARGLASSGDTVLLSPACASWDQFQDFEARGDSFRALVIGEPVV